MASRTELGADVNDQELLALMQAIDPNAVRVPPGVRKIVDAVMAIERATCATECEELNSIINECDGRDCAAALRARLTPDKALRRVVGLVTAGEQMITWTCHICGRERPDELIGVCCTDISAELGMPAGTMGQNVRYCLDEPECREKAKEFRFTQPKGG